MDTVEPVSGVLLGTLLFGERLAASPAGIAVQLAGAAAAVAGITLLGRYPGTTKLRNAAKQAGPAGGPAVRAAGNRPGDAAVPDRAAGNRPGHTAVPDRAADRSRPAGHRHTWAAR
jgi:hypothetical protein